MPKGIQLWSLPPMMERPRGPPDLKMIIVDIGDNNDANDDGDWTQIMMMMTMVMVMVTAMVMLMTMTMVMMMTMVMVKMMTMQMVMEEM